jgi:hypothetical protein
LWDIGRWVLVCQQVVERRTKLLRGVLVCVFACGQPGEMPVSVSVSVWLAGMGNLLDQSELERDAASLCENLYTELDIPVLLMRIAVEEVLTVVRDLLVMLDGL